MSEVTMMEELQGIANCCECESTEKRLNVWIKKATAAPEQEPAYVVPCSVDWYGYPGGYVDTKYAPDVWKVVEHLENLLDAIPTEPLYTHPSAEIERLRAENKRLDLALAQADHNYDCDRQQFEQKLAEAQALLRAWDQPTRVAIKVLERTLSPTAMEIALELKRCLGDSCDFLSATAKPAEVKS